MNPAGQEIQLGSLQTSKPRNPWRPWARAPNSSLSTKPFPGGQGMPINEHLPTSSLTKRVGGAQLSEPPPKI